MFKRLSILSIIVATMIGFSSCGDDNDDENGFEINSSSSFSINGEKVREVYQTLCEVHTLPALNDEPSHEIELEAYFYYEDELMSFNYGLSASSINALKKGMDITDYMRFYRFYPMNWAITSSKHFEVLSGNAVVESVSSEAVVIRYTNFELLREISNTEDIFTINGTISYTIND